MVSLLSVRAYARHRAARGLPGTSHTAVQHAVAAGRIRLTPEGKVDADEADRLWAANTDGGHRRNPGREQHLRAVPATDEQPDTDGPVPDYQESRARREAAEAGLAELELAQEQGKLLPALDVEARLVKVFTESKNKLRGVPSRARQQDPALTVAQLALFGTLIDEALEGLSRGAP